MDKNGKTTIVLTRSGWILPKATFKRIEKQFIYIDLIAAWYMQSDILMKSCSSSSFFLFCKETVSILILVPALSSFWHSTPAIPAEKSALTYIVIARKVKKEKYDVFREDSWKHTHCVLMSLDRYQRLSCNNPRPETQSMCCCCCLNPV